MTGRRWLYAWGLGSVPVGAASLLVPLYVVRLGGSPFDLGLLGAVAAFIGTPGAIVWGRLADRTANPRAVVPGSLLAVAVLLGLMAALPSIPARRRERPALARRRRRRPGAHPARGGGRAGAAVGP